MVKSQMQPCLRFNLHKREVKGWISEVRQIYLCLVLSLDMSGQ